MEGPQTMKRSAARAAKTEVSIATKLQMLEDIDNNVSPQMIARKFNVSVSTVSYILKRRKKIEEAAELNEGRKRLVRSTKYQHVNNMVLEFYSRCQAMLIPYVFIAFEVIQDLARNTVLQAPAAAVKPNFFWFCSVAGPLLQTVSRQFATALGMDSFTGSNGWAAAFLHRNRITSFARRGEKKEDRRRRMLTDHQKSMVNAIVSDVIRNSDSFKGDEPTQTVVVVPISEPQPVAAPFAELTDVNIAFEPLGTVELIPHHSSLPAPDDTGLGRQSAKRLLSGNLKIRDYAQAIQALSALQRYAFEQGSSAVLPMLGQIAALFSKVEVEKAQRKPLNSKKRRIQAEDQQDQSQSNVEIVQQSQTSM